MVATTYHSFNNNTTSISWYYSITLEEQTWPYISPSWERYVCAWKVCEPDWLSCQRVCKVHPYSIQTLCEQSSISRLKRSSCFPNLFSLLSFSHLFLHPCKLNKQTSVKKDHATNLKLAARNLREALYNTKRFCEQKKIALVSHLPGENKSFTFQPYIVLCFPVCTCS